MITAVRLLDPTDVWPDKLHVQFKSAARFYDYVDEGGRQRLIPNVYGISEWIDSEQESEAVADQLEAALVKHTKSVMAVGSAVFWRKTPIIERWPPEEQGITERPKGPKRDLMTIRCRFAMGRVTESKLPAFCSILKTEGQSSAMLADLR